MQPVVIEIGEARAIAQFYKAGFGQSGEVSDTAYEDRAAHL
jgi:hypothetical protein